MTRSLEVERVVMQVAVIHVSLDDRVRWLRIARAAAGRGVLRIPIDPVRSGAMLSLAFVKVWRS